MFCLKHSAGLNLYCLFHLKCCQVRVWTLEVQTLSNYCSSFSTELHNPGLLTLKYKTLYSLCQAERWLANPNISQPPSLARQCTYGHRKMCLRLNITNESVRTRFVQTCSHLGWHWATDVTWPDLKQLIQPTNQTCHIWTPPGGRCGGVVDHLTTGAPEWCWHEWTGWEVQSSESCSEETSCLMELDRGGMLLKNSAETTARSLRSVDQASPSWYRHNHTGSGLWYDRGETPHKESDRIYVYSTAESRGRPPTRIVIKDHVGLIENSIKVSEGIHEDFPAFKKEQGCVA